MLKAVVTFGFLFMGQPQEVQFMSDPLADCEAVIHSADTASDVAQMKQDVEAHFKTRVTSTQVECLAAN